MTAAEKLITVAENMPKVYDAGKSWVFSHMARPDGLFYKIAFPEGSSLRISLLATEGTLTEMFRLTTGLESLEVTMPDRPCKVNYFVYGSSLRVLRLPAGLQVADFTNFAARCSALEEVIGTIDLTESSSNDSCFNSCPQLREVRFAPGSIYKSLGIKNSEKLSAATVESILSGLATVDTPQTLTLHSTVKEALTETQKAALTAKNWLLA